MKVNRFLFNLNHVKLNQYIKIKQIMKVKDFWDNRYSEGGNSGRGSYGDHFTFKNDIINDIIKEYNINSILDFGCGDGNQISGISVKKYHGMDISKKSIDMCGSKYENDESKDFSVYDHSFVTKDEYNMTISLDVIYHIFEDDIYDQYMKDLIDSSNKYILIYSTNWDDGTNWNGHVRHRKFDTNMEGCILIKKIDNPLPDCPADFYLFQK